MKLVSNLLVIAMSASPGWAEPTQVFPLNGEELPAERRGTAERLTRAIADSIDADVSSVAIEDAAGLLDCDVEVTSCLELVSKSVGNKQLVFGTIRPGKGKTLKVTLTRFRPGPDRQQQTYEITGEKEAYPDELVRKAAPLFGGAKPAPIDTLPDEPDPVPGITDPVEPTDAPAPGKITAATWGLVGGGALGVAIGIGFRVSASGIAGDVASFPEPQTRSDFTRLNALEDRGVLHTRVGAALIVVGGAALGVGIVRAVLQRKAPAREQHVVGVTPIRGGAAITITWGME